MTRGALEDTTVTATTQKSPRFRRAGHVQQAEQGGTIVLFDGAHYYTLPSGTAADLWRLLAEPQSAEELVARLYDEYDAPCEMIETDVGAQLLLLQRHRLAVEVGHEDQGKTRPWWGFWRRAQ